MCKNSDANLYTKKQAIIACLSNFLLNFLISNVLFPYRSPIKNIEIKVLLKDALTKEINNREIYMKGIDISYLYEGYAIYKTEDLSK